MISVQEAIALIKHHPVKLGSQFIRIEKSGGHYLANSVKATREQPPFDRVAMDGIALSYNLLAKQAEGISLCGIQRAGSPALSLDDANGAIEVMTGASLPHNCDTVIPYEEVSIESGKVSLLYPEKVKKQQNIHFMASDYKKGKILVEAGTMINAAVIAVLASQGLREVEVKVLPRVAIISTGDELVEPGLSPEAWQIWRSNPYALKSELLGFAGLKDIDIELFHLPDEQDNIFSSLKTILSDFKIIILSGGVSKGKFDYVPTVLNDLGVKTIFHKIKQRPGKPMLFAVGNQGQNIFGLPGNPVSALICLRRYVVESLLMDLKAKRSSEFVELDEDISFSKKLTFFKAIELLRVEGQVVKTLPVKGNGSGDFFSLASSTGFVELPEDKEVFKKGEVYPLYRWNRS